MELTSGQRKALFALVVAALTALGIYMFVPGARGAGSHGSPPAPARSPSAPAASSAGASAAPPASNPAPAATTPSPPAIYQWLPFSPAKLASPAPPPTPPPPAP